MQHRRAAPSVLIVNEFDICRAGLKAILSAERNVKVAGELATATVTETLALCGKLLPDLVLLSLASHDRIPVIQAIKAAYPRTTVLVFGPDEVGYLVPAVEAGASGCVGWWTSREEVLSTIGRVLAGECVLPRQFVPEVFHLAALAAGGKQQAPAPQLTQRQRQVVALIARGMTNREISAELRVSPSTIKGHVERIIEVLGVSDRTQAAVRAIELGLLDDAGAAAQSATFQQVT